MQQALFVCALTLGRVAFGYQFQSLASIGPELMAEFDLHYASLGALIGLAMAPGIFVALPGGLLGRRFGERLVVGAGLLMMTLGGVVGAFAVGPGGIGLGRMLAGAGAVMLVVMQGQMVSDRFTGRMFMPVTGLLTGGFPVGVGLAGLTHDPIVRTWGWSGMFAAGAVAAAAACVLFLLTCGPPRLAGRMRWTLPSRRESALVIIAGLIWTAYNAGYSGFLSYIPSLLAARGHGPEVAATVMLLATWSNLPATVLGGALAARFGNAPILVLGTLAEALAVAGPAVLDVPLLWALLFGIGAALQAGVIIAIGTLSARPENRAVGMGMFYTTYYLGGTVLPAVCGRAADLVGDPGGALMAAAALSLLALPIFWLHVRLSRRAA